MKAIKFLIAPLAAGAIEVAVAATAEIEVVGRNGNRSTETVTLTESNGAFTLRLAKAEILARKAKSISIVPEFGHAKLGEAGFWISPNGQYGEFDRTNGTYTCSWPTMSMYGWKTPRGAYVAFVNGLKYYFTEQVRVKNGEYRIACMLNAEQCADPYEDFEIEFSQLEGAAATYAGMARAYRDRQLKRGAVKPLKERIKGNDTLKYAVEAPEIRIRQGWKPVPSPIPDQQPENEPPMKAVVTFDRVADIAREFKCQGVGKAEFCLVGWNIGGHDGRWPQMFPPDPRLGGEAKLRACIRTALDLGYLIVPHGNFRDAYRIADCWDAEWTIKNPDGTIKPAHTIWWGGGCPFEICPQRAYEKFAVKDMPRLAALGFRGLGYFDTVSILLAPKCDDPRHRCSRAESARYWGLCAEVSKSKFGGFASEGSLDHFAGSLDSVLYASFGDPRKTVAAYQAGKGIVKCMVPVWQIAYNGIIVNNPFTTTVNFTAQDRYSQLKLLEYGGRPNFYFYSKFVSDGKHWMGDSDLRCGTDEELKASVARVKAGWDIYAKLNHLQYEFIENHECLAPDVYRTTWANGESIIVNYGAREYSANGVTVAAESWQHILHRPF